MGGGGAFRPIATQLDVYARAERGPELLKSSEALFKHMLDGLRQASLDFVRPRRFHHPIRKSPVVFQP